MLSTRSTFLDYIITAVTVITAHEAASKTLNQPSEKRESTGVQTAPQAIQVHRQLKTSFKFLQPKNGR
jgi:hypothetical protein